MGLIERGQRSDSEPGVLLADRDFRMAVVCCLLPFFVDFFLFVFFMNKCEQIQQCPLIFMF